MRLSVNDIIKKINETCNVTTIILKSQLDWKIRRFKKKKKTLLMEPKFLLVKLNQLKKNNTSRQLRNKKCLLNCEKIIIQKYPQSHFLTEKKLSSISIHSSDDENVIIKCLEHFWVGLDISNPLTQLKTSTAALDPRHLKVEVAD